MYYTASLRSQHGICNCCRANASKCDGSTGPGDCPSEQGQYMQKMRRRRRLDADPSFMSYASNPDGPWTVGGQLFPDYQGADTNFAPLILPNGSLIAIWREWNGPQGSRCFLATAPNWRNTSTYVQHTDRELFPDLGPAGTEDPFLYRDNDGNFHAVFHHM